MNKNTKSGREPLPFSATTGRPGAGAQLDEERARISWHEAGHAAACWTLGGEIAGPLSIRPTKRWSGVAFTTPPAIAAADVNQVDAGLPCVTWPPGLRRSLEVEAIVFLAGPAAERHAPRAPLAPGEARYWREPAERLDRRLAARALAPLSATDAKLLTHGDGPEPPLRSDFERAHDLAELMTSPNGVRVHKLLAWLEEEAASMLRLPHVRAKLDRLGWTLHEHEVLSRGYVEKVLRAA